MVDLLATLAEFSQVIDHSLEFPLLIVHDDRLLFEFPFEDLELTSPLLELPLKLANSLLEIGRTLGPFLKICELLSQVFEFLCFLPALLAEALNLAFEFVEFPIPHSLRPDLQLQLFIRRQQLSYSVLQILICAYAAPQLDFKFR